MRIKIGHVELNGNVEAEFRFDKTLKHDWCGPKVKLTSIDIYVEFFVGAVSHNFVDGQSTVHTSRQIHMVVTEEKGRQLTRTISVKTLKDAMEHGYPIGWSDGPTKVVVTDEGMRLIDDVNMSIAG